MEAKGDSVEDEMQCQADFMKKIGVEILKLQEDVEKFKGEIKSKDQQIEKQKVEIDRLKEGIQTKVTADDF